MVTCAPQLLDALYVSYADASDCFSQSELTFCAHASTPDVPEYVAMAWVVINKLQVE